MSQFLVVLSFFFDTLALFAGGFMVYATIHYLNSRSDDVDVPPEWEIPAVSRPPKPGIYKVLKLDSLEGKMRETDGRWNGEIWVNVEDKKDETSIVYLWRCY